jgi:HK97 family phage prohead protease
MKMKMMTIKSVEEQEGIFEGYLSTYGNTDRVGDIIENGAFKKSLKNKKTSPMLFNHNRDKVMGKLELSSDNKGLFVKGTLNMNDPEAQNISNLLKMGALDSMSIGMSISKYEPIEPAKPLGGWLIKEAEIYEGSIVTIPCNPQATINTSKSLDDEERKELEQLRTEIKMMKLNELLIKIGGNK